jgi:catechol 2,3-dioxygenase
MSSFARLKETGIEPDYCLNHGVATSLYYTDPDQNLVELQVDNFGNWDASAEWMRTSEAFRQNPRGAFFDADRIFAAYKAGATFQQLFIFREYSDPGSSIRDELILPCRTRKARLA